MAAVPHCPVLPASSQWLCPKSNRGFSAFRCVRRRRKWDAGIEVAMAAVKRESSFEPADRNRSGLGARPLHGSLFRDVALASRVIVGCTFGAIQLTD